HPANRVQQPEQYPHHAAFARPESHARLHAVDGPCWGMRIRCLVVFILIGCGQSAKPAESSPTPAPTAAIDDQGTAPAPAASEQVNNPTAPPAGKRPPCTSDQSCNDDESISGLWGKCTPLGVCECNPGFELNPRGRCAKPIK